MKKFLAIVFALIFALSACTVAFADAAVWTCPEEGCKAVLSTQALYDAHVNGGCLVKFTDCEYCEARVARTDIDAHIASCPKYSETCEYCTAEFDKKADYDAHECEVLNTVENEDVAGVVGDAIEAVKNIDWEDVLAKVIDFISGIDFEGLIGKVSDLLGGIDFEGLIAKIKPYFESLTA